MIAKEFERYSRQIAIPSFGEAGQRKLEAAHVVVAGLGGLGSAASLYLVAAGVGHLTIIDAQRVELSNLNRQVLHWPPDINRLKAKSAMEKLHAMNPSVSIEAKPEKVTQKNIHELLRNADVVIDGTDNYQTRYLLNEACVRIRKPFVHGAVEGLTGQLTTIIPGDSPCLKCIIPKPLPRRPTLPVLGAAPGVIGCLQAMETIKLLIGMGEPLIGRMLFFDGRSTTFQDIEVHRDPNCPVCGSLAFL
jgi:molybdopterin/thiamine biosynthesis adenylyltransferase